jgi:hypothetical protein
MTMRTLFGSVETAAAADPDGSWAAAQASDAALAAYLRRLAELRARQLESAEGQYRSAEGQHAIVQDSSCKAARWGSLKLGPSARVRNSLGLTPVQRRNAR